MAVLERTREIGILAAIGWSTERITGAIVIEGFIRARSSRRSSLGVSSSVCSDRIY